MLHHKLAIFLEAKPIAQKQRKLREERRKVVERKTDKLLKADFIHEVDYTTWLANVVMVKKATRKWRMCVDYTFLNKACGFRLLNFINTYSVYIQIKMYPLDLEKATFITSGANFGYKVCPLA